MVGPSGWGEQLQPTSGVILAGVVSASELSGLYTTARLLVYVPIIEGFGLPPVEAMSVRARRWWQAHCPSTAGAAFDVDPMDDGSIAQGSCRWRPTKGCGRASRLSDRNVRPS